MDILLSDLLLNWKPKASRPLYKSLYEALKVRITGHALQGGSVLPTSRNMAVALGVSRNTIMQALDMLIADGFLETRQGAGVFVTNELDGFDVQQSALESEATVTLPALNTRAEKWLKVYRNGRVGANAKAFAPGKPALEDFPFDVWARLLSRRWRMSGARLAMAEDSKGDLSLRKHVARYLSSTRGGMYDPEDILIVSGAQQGLDLIARVLWEQEDVIVTDDPTFPGISGVLAGTGVKHLAVPIDDEGVLLDQIPKEEKIKSFLVTPSRNYPVGVTMSLARRLELLKVARRCQAWVVEDDYDCDFRFDGPPLSSLQSIDPDGRVIYVGSFSRIIFPALRLGFIVAPKSLVPAFEAAKAFIDGHTSIIHQSALADFFEEGYFHSHLRRMKKIYAKRRRYLIDLIDAELSDQLTVAPADGGLHICALLKNRSDDEQLSSQLLVHGVAVRPLSRFYKGPKKCYGFVMGFAGYSEQELGDAITIVKKILRDAKNTFISEK
ncbi:PLP-dependent aminotransferase family protein [Terasakiella pusilla]|uniref:MocR-like pyridoxine biosynthesis transcription factor PdxR n=1 Tax=Terasakiella pusilla TaxID=64973 RepID=UPI003AA9C2AE